MLAVLCSGCNGGHSNTLYTELDPADENELTVPDFYTAVIGQTVGNYIKPVLGSDNKWHGVYELMLTNARPIDASIHEIKILDYNDTGRVLHTLTATEIIEAAVTLSGRPRLEPDYPVLLDGDAVLQPNESMVVYVELVFDSASDVPDAIVHQFSGSAATNPGSAYAEDVEYLLIPRAIDKSALPVAGQPLTGDGWVVVNGCCSVDGAHRSSIQTISGKLRLSQRFAIDWMKIGDNGMFFEGDPADVANWHNYDEPVLAVADGTVVEVLDELDDQPPGVLPDPNTITIETVDGNHVILDIGEGVYVFYAHLKRGSVSVEAGDTVRRGDVIGRLGNSGNTSAPHLHIHFMDAPSALASDGIPYQADNFVVTGRIPRTQWYSSSDALDDVWDLLPPLEPELTEAFMPLNLDVGSFSASD